MKVLGDPSAAIFASAPRLADVIEAFIEGKAYRSSGSDRASDSEDRLVVTEIHAAVIDGMSSPLREAGSDGSGKDYALAVVEAVQQFERDWDAVKALELVAEYAARVQVGHDGPSGAVLAIVSFARREVWRVGDVHVRIGSRSLPGTKLVDEAAALFRAAINAAYLANGSTVDDCRRTDPGLEALRPLLEVQQHLANRVGLFGYGVVNGSTIPERYVEVYEVPDGVSDVALATDGFLNAAATLEEAQRQLVAQLSEDPVCLGEGLRGMGKAIPVGGFYPDDRCYLRLALH